MSELNLVGCSDVNCIIKKPEGQHTNGGCMCLLGLPFEKRFMIKKKLYFLEKENRELKQKIEWYWNKFNV